MKQFKTHTLINDFLEVEVLNYGATLKSIKHLKSENLLLAFENIEDYINQPSPYLNATVGPVAGRIAYGEYWLDSKKQKLSTDYEVNHLHGGETGISKQFFEFDKLSDNEVVLSYRGNHSIDGFKGEFHYYVRYLLEGNKLIIELEGIPQDRTLLNMTNHLYFNLSGDMSESIAEGFLNIDSEIKLSLHQDGFPDKFESMKPINNVQIKELLPLNTPFVFEEGSKLVYSQNETEITVTSDANCIVLYSAFAFDSSLILNQGQNGYPSCGLAIECQDIPNGINLDLDPEQFIYSPKKPYHQRTEIEFNKLNSQ